MRTAARSTGADAPVRSSTASARCSSTEGLRQKILLDHELPDLRMQLRQFGLARRLYGLRLAGERRRHALDRLLLPGRDHRLMNAVLRHQLGQSQLAPDRLQRHLRLELSRVPLARNLAHPNPSFSSTGAA